MDLRKRGRPRKVAGALPVPKIPRRSERLKKRPTEEPDAKGGGALELAEAGKGKERGPKKSVKRAKSNGDVAAPKKRGRPPLRNKTPAVPTCKRRRGRPKKIKSPQADVQDEAESCPTNVGHSEGELEEK